MRTGPLHRELSLQTTLLADAKDIRQSTSGCHRRATTLVNGVGRFDFSRVVLGEPSEAIPAAVLLVRAGGQHQ